MLCPFKKKVTVTKFNCDTVTKEEFLPCEMRECAAWGIAKHVPVPPGRASYAGETVRAEYGCTRLINKPMYISE